FLPSDACELTLDPGTAHQNLLLSEGNRKVTWVEEEQKNPHHLKRSDQSQQVLCQQGLDRRSYWEVEVFGPLSVGVTYRGTGRKKKMDHVQMGQDDRSWCLVCSDDGYYVQHNSDKVDVPSLGLRHSRVGVYLDRQTGTLSFYRVSSDSLTHLHTFKTQFRERLYPAVELHARAFASFCPLA
ncbi:stonustoxin subunit beta-like, partial [Mastacembelus armatus]|uniref:stonustoxin subunit beta-like n=1 Tax=Mastacembelus armatus TaxID=205130 RepID=UPI000E466284